MALIKYVFFLFGFVSFSTFPLERHVQISDHIKAWVNITGSVGNYMLSYTVNSGSSQKDGKFLLPVESENLKIVKRDYNFDGNNDFAIVYSDEGQGVNSIYRIFLFSESKGFYELYFNGESEFPNIIVDVENKKVTYTCFDPMEVIPQRCNLNFPVY